MKKIIALLLMLSCIFVFAACGKETVDDGKALETAETYIAVTGNAGSLAIDENAARTLLEVYPQELLGLAQDIYEYELKLSATRFMNADACLVEAIPQGEETAEGTFIILGQQCYWYNPKTQKYLLLTVDGAVAVEDEVTNNTTQPSFVYDIENNKKLQEKFSSYTKDQLGLDKAVADYVLVVTGTTTTAQNGETVYVVRVYEKTGDATSHTLAFNENNNYKFDYATNRYVKL